MPGLAVLVSLDLYGPLRPATIASLLGGTSTMTTKVVGRLERLGTVTRVHGAVPDDRRAVVVSLTDDGREAIRSCERALAALGLDLLASIAAVSLRNAGDDEIDPSTVDIPGMPQPATSPALAEFLRCVVEVDKPLLATVGEIEPLHPADPRGLLLLSELDLRGPLRVGAVSALIDRSRGAADRLILGLANAGLVVRNSDEPSDDRRAVTVELTAVGRAVIRGAVAAVTTHLPQLRPALVSFSRALAGEHQGLGARAR
jgi:DNA-binding MarR family transcriptional regulator